MTPVEAPTQRTARVALPPAVALHQLPRLGRDGLNCLLQLQLHHHHHYHHRRHQQPHYLRLGLVLQLCRLRVGMRVSEDGFRRVSLPTHTRTRTHTHLRPLPTLGLALRKRVMRGRGRTRLWTCLCGIVCGRCDVTPAQGVLDILNMPVEHFH